MNKCGYYSCFKGRPTCKHPEKGEIITKAYGECNMGKYCEHCKRSHGGIYPSQLPTVRFEDVEIVDDKGNVIG